MLSEHDTYAQRAATPYDRSAALEVRGLRVSYGAQLVLEDVSFRLAPGQLVGIIGPNGAGKTTLLKALLGLVPIESGRMTASGATITRRGGHLAYVPQRDAINWRFPATVADVVLMGRYGRLGWFKRPGPQDRAIAQHCLEQVGMQAFARRPIAALSGGQQQRVFLARALAQEPEVLLLDEPISGVDAPTQESILTILNDLADQGKTLLLTTHDLHCNMEHFDALLALNRRVVALGPVEQVLTPDVLTRTYGTQVVLADGQLGERRRQARQVFDAEPLGIPIDGSHRGQMTARCALRSHLSEHELASCGIKADRDGLSRPRSAQPVMSASQADLSILAHRPRPALGSQVAMHPRQREQLQFPLRLVRTARDQQFGMRQQRWLPSTAAGARGAFGIEFVPVGIHPILQLAGIGELLTDQGALIQGAMAAFHTAIALGGVARDQTMLDTQADPP